MGTDKVVFEVERCGGATGSHVIGSDVSHVTGSDISQRKLRHIRPSGAFWSEVTLVTWPENALSGRGTVRKCVLRTPGFSPRFFLYSSNMATEGHLTPSWSGPVQKWPWPEVGSAHARLFPAFVFLLVATWVPDVTKGHLTPSEFPWVCACATRSCVTPVVVVNNVGWGVFYDVRVL
jgi:hypothetical protein